jgi:hypothetical protein
LFQDNKIEYKEEAIKFGVREIQLLINLIMIDFQVAVLLKVIPSDLIMLD